jgi:hypothetical protein
VSVPDTRDTEAAASTGAILPIIPPKRILLKAIDPMATIINNDNIIPILFMAVVFNFNPFNEVILI